MIDTNRFAMNSRTKSELGTYLIYKLDYEI